ncbi:MAG: PA0069 family radical SAM protein [Myxococcota bacterium]
MARAKANPRNRFATEQLEYEEVEGPSALVEVARDSSRSILSRNDSPDLGFKWSVNPYRGCFHGCAYCYARPSHEYLGLGAGTDFERKLTIKPEAPALLRAAFDRPSWKGQLVLFSGVTDCYQPLEAEHELTRGCLEVCAEYRNPVGIVTKSTLVTRDIDLLCRLRDEASVTVSMSIPVFETDRARAVEPYVPSPVRRLKVIERLAEAGIEVCLNVAPVIPGLSEHGLEGLLRTAADAGAARAWYTLLRLPGAVAPVFEGALRERLPLTADKTLARIREARGGRINDPRFHTRMTGEGAYARTFALLFERLLEKHGLTRREVFEMPNSFRRPTPQLSLFSLD